MERGSTAFIETVEDPTTFLTFDTFGSEDAGPGIASIGFALPGLLAPSGQLDFVAVAAGPGESTATELRAGGLGYRLQPWGPGTTLYANASYAVVAPDGPLLGAFGIEGNRTLLALGLRRDIAGAEGARTTVVLEARARDSFGEAGGATILDERLGALFLGVRHSTGQPLGRQTRLAAALSAGVADYGDSPLPGALASARGADEDFLRVSASAEGSIPLSPLWAVNAGIVGQWSAASLPASQKCGFGTNAYARGFDVSEVTGDSCLGARVELAANLLRRPGGAAPKWLQPFAGIDGGRVWANGNALVPASDDDWSSLSAGVRALGDNWVAEVSATRAITSPAFAATREDETRFWVRAALRF